MTPEQHEIVEQAARGTPAVVGAIAAAMTLNHWVALATLVYIIVQLLYLIRKWWREEVDRWRSQEEPKNE